jgi:hypothetical protein
MEDKEAEKDNIYVYSEENEIDTSAPNISQIDNYVLNDDGGEDENPNKGKNGKSPLMLLLQIMLNPVNGWKAVRRQNLKSETAEKDCFYPLLALMTLSKFAVLFYSSRVELSEILIDAVTSFVSFFFGYFCILILLKIVMAKDVAGVFETNFGKVFVSLSLSSLCLFFTIMELLPMLWAVLIFLPLWTVYMVCRGTRFFRFPERRQIIYTGVLCLLIEGVPVLINWGLSQILPK